MTHFAPEKTVIQSHEQTERPRVDRVIWTSKDESLLATIDVFAPRAQPVVHAAADLQAAIPADAHAIEDPYLTTIPTGSGISIAATQARDNRSNG